VKDAQQKADVKQSIVVIFLKKIDKESFVFLEGIGLGSAWSLCSKSRRHTWGWREKRKHWRFTIHDDSVHHYLRKDGKRV